MRRIVLLLLALALPAAVLVAQPPGSFRAQVAGPELADGTAVDCDLPAERHRKNIGGSDGAGLCLAADTPINTTAGAISISELNPAVHSILYHDAAGKVSATGDYRVAKTGTAARLCVVDLQGGRSLRLTGDHRLATAGGSGRYYFTQAAKLRAGDKVITEAAGKLGTDTVARVRFEAQRQPVDLWDIEVKAAAFGGEGNFFANGVLCHNCVFTSIGHAADWCGELCLADMQDFMRTRPGGGYPEKVAAMIKAKCQQMGVPEPPYIQDTSGNLDLVAAAVQSGHLVGVTYGFSPSGRYNGQKIAHMVNCAAAREGPNKLWAILDNNYPGTYEWMSEEDFKRVYNAMGGGWCVILLKDGPPPPPRN